MTRQGEVGEGFVIWMSNLYLGYDAYGKIELQYPGPVGDKYW